MCDLISTSPESGLKHHDSFLHNMTTTSIDDQAINSWIAQGTQADHMEVLDSQSYSGALGHYGSQMTPGQDDLFATMNPYHESDRPRSALMSPKSSTSLFPFPNTTMSYDSWMNLTPTTLNALSSMNDCQQPPDGLEGQASLHEVTETATPTSSNEVPLVMTPPKRGKTVLTLENLDSDTRSEVLDLLFRRKIVTTIEIG